MEQTPTLLLQSPSINDTVSDVPYSSDGSVTKEQLERDLVRVRKQIDELQKKERSIQGVLELYFDAPAAQQESSTSLDHYTITDACSIVFTEEGNQWMSLAELDNELRRRGKVCSKGSIELALKNDSGRFEIEKKGKRNFFRRIERK